MSILLNSILSIHSAILTAGNGSNLLFIQDANGITEEFSDPAQLKIILILLIVFAFIAIFGLVFAIRSFRELKLQYRVIEQQHEEIAEKNKELAFKNESLEEINMEKDNMISIVAHDLKAPLGNIQGLVELIKLDQKVLTDNQNEYIGMLNQVSRDAADMVDIMLNVHRIESELHKLTLHEYDILELMGNVIKLHEPAAKLKKAKIEFTTVVESSMLSTDKQYFQQILSNILQNAIDYAPNSSVVTVTHQELSNSVRISVTDQGSGISETDQKRLFSGYNKVDGDNNESKPSGIGLKIVAKLLEKLHGRVDVTSSPGSGATFTIELIK